MRYEREQLGDGFSVPCARLRLVLDNMLTAHGRSTFTGSRRLFAALGDRPGTASAELTR